MAIFVAGSCSRREGATLTKASEASFSSAATASTPMNVDFGGQLSPTIWPFNCLSGLSRGWPAGCGVRVVSCCYGHLA